MCPFWISSLIWRLISSFSMRECQQTGPLGNGTPGIKSMECLTSQCTRTPTGVVKMSLYDSTILSTCFCCIEGFCVEAMDVAVIFRYSSERTMKSTNLPVWEITFLHCFAVMRDTAVAGSASSILQSFFTKVIMTLRGLDSYTTWCFHIYSFPKRTSQNSSGETLPHL